MATTPRSSAGTGPRTVWTVRGAAPVIGTFLSSTSLITRRGGSHSTDWNYRLSSELAERRVTVLAGNCCVEDRISPMSLRAAQKQMTYELFLAKALELFGTKGYAATTIDDIATAAGSTRTTF